jgi:hypothetical protein
MEVSTFLGQITVKKGTDRVVMQEDEAKKRGLAQHALRPAGSAPTKRRAEGDREVIDRVLWLALFVLFMLSINVYRRDNRATARWWAGHPGHRSGGACQRGLSLPILFGLALGRRRGRVRNDLVK